MSDVIAKIAPTANTDFATSVRASDGTGIFPSQKIKDMTLSGEIKATMSSFDHDQIQPASIDLRLGNFAYPVDTSFLPGRDMKVLEKLKHLDAQFDDFKFDLNKGAVLEKGRVYVIRLQESIALKSEVAAFANPKSSTGRLDILTRLIADNATSFDQVSEGYKGDLFIEVAPRSFSVVVKTGTRLNQLRFRRSRGEEAKSIPAAEWKRLLDEGQVVDCSDHEKTGVVNAKFTGAGIVGHHLSGVFRRYRDGFFGHEDVKLIRI